MLRYLKTLPWLIFVVYTAVYVHKTRKMERMHAGHAVKTLTVQEHVPYGSGSK